jgi:hypothetical protein
MDKHRELTDEVVNEVYLYALGMLSDEEFHAYEQHLQAGCAICRDQVQAFQPVAEALATAVPPVSPAQNVRSGLLNRIRREIGQRLPEGFTLSLSAESVWESMGAPGVRMRMLAIENGFRTFLVQFDPGATFPAHLHTGVEHCYIVWGDISSGAIRLGQDDFQRAERNTLHTDLRSENGCLLLMTTADGAEFAEH